MATGVQRFTEPPAMDPIQTANRSDWKRTTDVRLTRENFLDLLYGKTPTIRETAFVPADICWKHETELSPQLTPYKHNTGPLLNKVGVAQFEYQAQAEQDFRNRGDGEHTS